MVSRMAIHPSLPQNPESKPRSANSDRDRFYCAVAYGGGATAVVGGYIAVIGYVPLLQAKLVGFSGAAARFVGGATALAATAYINAYCRR